MIKGLKTIEVIHGNIFHLIFNNRKNLGMAFVRFQEHCDSPEFKDKCFTINEFSEWYMKEKNMDIFTYYTDWAGYNFPNTALTAFREGRFAELTNAEKTIIGMFGQVKGKFYVIGSVVGDTESFKHEMAHALYYLNPKYRKKMESIVDKYNTESIKIWLRSRGYSEDVMTDEIQAYMAVTPTLVLKPNAAKHYKELITETTNLFEHEYGKIL